MIDKLNDRIAGLEKRIEELTERVNDLSQQFALIRTSTPAQAPVKDGSKMPEGLFRGQVLSVKPVWSSQQRDRIGLKIGLDCGRHGLKHVTVFLSKNNEKDQAVAKHLFYEPINKGWCLPMAIHERVNETYTYTTPVYLQGRLRVNGEKDFVNSLKPVLESDKQRRLFCGFNPVSDEKPESKEQPKNNQATEQEVVPF